MDITSGEVKKTLPFVKANRTAGEESGLPTTKPGKEQTGYGLKSHNDS